MIQYIPKWMRKRCISRIVTKRTEKHQEYLTNRSQIKHFPHFI